MNKILETALAAERKAAHIISAAEQVRADCERSIENAGKIKDEYLNKSRAVIERYYSEKSSEAKAEEDSIATKLERSLADMDARFDMHGDEWADTMVKNITKL